MGLVILIAIGALAGYMATRMMDVEANPVVTIAIGIVGALLGALLLRALLFMIGALAGLLGALIGALLLIWIWQSFVTR
ncbi:hypothetical protein U879_05225 [Defluviimonas sp. 20V17]|uniref:Transglycosylase associated protein n=1 Tax=Allgaiera indica TaxID=765699 RepID=A0AAN4UNT6_9RHOB|nr:GlsB/YeaQ/YmgE family stress response membrane protein [Allgaiera indica]KDB04731.1 hypothetical protein U879_05225 [Defluviimonas sp. 20V17]GHD99103.1 hypothetical protein GCM10008024_05290 [Allgaiera indica]SDW00526.1 Transglycosylase associated protein [Allgaiera indica]